jgi:hypothetical protein
MFVLSITLTINVSPGDKLDLSTAILNVTSPGAAWIKVGVVVVTSTSVELGSVVEVEVCVDEAVLLQLQASIPTMAVTSRVFDIIVLCKLTLML